MDWLLVPLWDRFTGLFDLNGRIGLAFFLISALVAFVLYRVQRGKGYTQANSFWQFLGGREVFLHRSAIVDYQYYLFLSVLLKIAIIVPVIALVDPYLFKTRDVMGFLENVWGARPTLGDNLGLSLLYGLGVFVVSDFASYWCHRIFHSGFLWEFHKVHHSAPVLVPFTAARVHFVEKIADKVLTTVLVASFAGLFWYLCGGRVDRYTLFGVTYIVFIFNILASNLRHSHVWFSFGPKLEHLLNSPAQHQIHHSDKPEHFHKNFGTNLSVWDWMFGTLYTTTPKPEKIRFGTGDQDTHRYLSLSGLVFTPFRVLAARLHPRFEKSLNESDAAYESRSSGR